MNFFEAMEAVAQGKIVQSSLIDEEVGKNYTYSMKNNVLAYTTNKTPLVVLSDPEIKGHWSIVEPEKPKVKKWLWAYKCSSGVWYQEPIFRTEENAKAHFGSQPHQKQGEPIEVEE